MTEAQELEAGRSAWNRATVGITGVDDVLADFRERFAEAIVAGKSLHELEDALQDTLAERDWTWPWFEEWYKTFSDWKMFPFLWPPMAPDEAQREQFSAEELAAYRRAAIAPLIAHTAAMIFFRDRHVSRARQDQKWRLAHMNDPAEMRVATEKEVAIMSGDLSTLPPFFPGDRTTLQGVRPLGPKDDVRPPEQE